MQHRLHRALRESFTSRNLPIPPLPAYRQLPRIAIQRDAPRPLWSCGTFAVSTTCYLLLRGIAPHSFPIQFITREHIVAMHRALLEWLIQGNPSDLWTRGCLDLGILLPQGTFTGPYDCLGIAAANLLPKGKGRLAPCSPLGASSIPLVLIAPIVEYSLHPPPFTGVRMDQGAKENPHPTYGGLDPSARAARPPPSAQRAPTSRSSPLLLLLSRRDIHSRTTTAKRAPSVRIRANKRQHQSMLTDHWPELRPASHPVYHRTKAPPSPIPRSLCNLG
jgi:hypothetical protein